MLLPLFRSSDLPILAACAREARQDSPEDSVSGPLMRGYTLIEISVVIVLIGVILLHGHPASAGHPDQ